MGSIINEASLDAANTAFETAANDIFSGDLPGAYQVFTTNLNMRGKRKFELDLVDGVPQLREWIGSRQFGQLRAYTLTKSLRKWEQSIRVDVDDINADAGGMVAKRLTDFVNRASRIYDKIVFDELLSNPTGYDGVALLSNSHPVNGATHDNLGAALTYATFKAGMEAFAGFTDYEGEYLGLSADTLVVGPALMELAMQITGSDKIVGVDNAGEIGGTAISSEKLPNYQGGSVRVVVSDRIQGSGYSNSWFLVDTKQGLAKPMCLGEFVAPFSTIKDSPEDDNVYHDDEVLYSLTAKATPAAMNWQTIYGYIA